LIQHPGVEQGSRRRVRIPAHVSPRFRRAYIIVCFLFISSAAFSQFTGLGSRPADLSKIRKQEIVDVRVTGNDNIPTLLITSMLLTKPSSDFDVFIHSLYDNFGNPRQLISRESLVRDTETIYLLYRERGYFDAKVTYKIIEDEGSVEEWLRIYEKNRLLPPKEKEDYPNILTIVEFTIDEGKQMKVGGFTFEGLEHLPPELMEKATSEIGIKINTPYSESAVKEEYIRTETFLEENGYPFFNRDSVFASRIYGTDKVVTTIYFNTGNRCKLGDIIIRYEEGSDTSNKVAISTIERLLEFEEGDWFQNSKMTKSERNLYQLGTFDAARIGLDTSVWAGVPLDKRDGMALPVLVSLRMRSTADVALGVSASSGSVGTAFGLKGAYNNRNFFGGGESVSLSSSYQVLPTSQISWDISGSLGLPWVGITGLPVQIGVVGSRFAQFDKETDTMQMDVNSISIPITTRYNIFQNDNYRMNIGGGFSFERISNEIRDSSLIADFEEISKDPQLNFIVSADIVLDGTNDIFNPTKGTSYTLSSEIGTPILAIVTGSDLPSASYWKNSFQIRNFLSLKENGSVFASRLYAGYADLLDPANPSRDVPQTRKYLGGGMTSFRGWPTRSLLVSNLGTGTIIGGYTTLGGSFEFRFAPFQYDMELTTWQQLAAPIRMAIFADFGNVWDKETPIILKNFTLTTGIGLRYNTPFGPLRIDWGFKFYDPYYCLNSQESFPTSAEPIWIFRRQFNWKTLFDLSSIGFTIGNAF
jgi:outer membrane protein insertion porin family